MHFKENTMLALNGIRSNKMRAMLTMLGIIIGISSVITIVTVGNSMTSSITTALNDMGANSIQIFVNSKPDENGNYGSDQEYTESDLISEEMLKEYKDAFGDKIYAYAVTVWGGDGESQNQRNKAKGTLVGTNAGALKIQNVDIVAGHFLNDREVNGVKNVVVISDKFAEKLFPGVPFNDVLSREIKFVTANGQYSFNIVGLYHYELKGFAATMGGDTTTSLFIPIKLAQKIAGTKYQGYNYAQIRADASVTDCEAFSKQTTDFFNNRFYRSNKYFQIESQNMDSMIKQSQTMMSTMKLAIGIIAGISLLVGGIGVMNIMMVSVTER
ncbi:MAG: ABC transporter permease, partial [Oscillospiraceae bacterium]